MNDTLFAKIELKYFSLKKIKKFGNLMFLTNIMKKKKSTNILGLCIQYWYLICEKKNMDIIIEQHIPQYKTKILKIQLV